MDKIGAIFAPLNWSLLLKDKRTGQLYFKIVVGASADKLRGKHVPKGKGIANWIAESGQSVIIEDVKKDSRFNDYFDKLTGFETKSIIGVPLKTESKVFGVIELVNKLNGNNFTPYELNVLRLIADFAAIAIGRVYYYRALKKMATIDPLTKVGNRRVFERVFQKEVARCKRYGGEVSLLMLDINDFKKINDQFGHSAGDIVLRNLASILKDSIRRVDIVARYGGDEFVVLMPNTTLDKAKKVKNRIERKIEKYNKSGEVLPFTVSIGIHAAGPENVDDLLMDADIDLYKKKSQKEDINYEDISEFIEDFIEEGDISD